MIRRIVAAGLAATALAFAAQAQTLRPDISAHRHPNLAAAQRLIERADARIIDAQRANEWDLDGHAAHAKELLEQADAELKAAAHTSNREHH